MKEVDARGLACPTPVLMTKTAVEDEKAQRITVVVDNEASQQNVVRFLESKGYQATASKSGADYIVTGQVGEQSIPESFAETPQKKVTTDQPKIMVMCATDRIGYGDDELGRKLMVNFIKTMREMGSMLWRLVFVNNGVKLTVEGSELVSVLKDYEDNGLAVLVCGTCLTHFDLLDQKQVGKTTNMLDIVTAMQLADKVITL
jgi:selenium metabolism protein YedF